MREDAAVTLASWHPELVAAYQKWLADPAAVVDTRLQPDGPNIQIRFQPLSVEQRSDVVMFLEDLSATEAQAQQIKLAALCLPRHPGGSRNTARVLRTQPDRAAPVPGG